MSVFCCWKKFNLCANRLVLAPKYEPSDQEFTIRRFNDELTPKTNTCEDLFVCCCCCVGSLVVCIRVLLKFNENFQKQNSHKQTMMMRRTCGQLLKKNFVNVNKFSRNAFVHHQQQHRTFKLDRLVMPGPKSLDQIVKLNLLEKETPEVVQTIWSKYHFAMNDAIAHTLTSSQYQTLMSRGLACPMFVLPLFRNIGFVNMVLQFQRGHVLYSSLREFQRIGEFASPYLTLSHYNELERSKGIVLMRGEVNTKEIDKGQAKEIVELMYKFYLDDRLFRDFVEPFNKTPHLFSFQNLMVAIQMVKPPKITKSKLLQKFEGKYVNTSRYDFNQQQKGDSPLVPTAWDPSKNKKY